MRIVIARAHFCECFMKHVEARQIFSDHLRRMSHARGEYLKVIGELGALRSELFDRIRGELPGCECHPEICSCLCNKQHPLHPALFAEWEKEKEKILMCWNDRLQKWKISSSDEEFAISKDWDNASFYSREIDVERCIF